MKLRIFVSKKKNNSLIIKILKDFKNYGFKKKYIYNFFFLNYNFYNNKKIEKQKIEIKNGRKKKLQKKRR